MPIRCCVPKCSVTCDDKIPLHTFPHPEKDPDRFRSWLYAIDVDLLSLHNKYEYIYKYRRVCHIHFEVKYQTWTRRLSANAIPTLHLPDSTVSMHIFPHPERFPDQFHKWVEIVGGQLNTPEDYTFFRTKRLCDRHFTEKDRNRNNRLNALAVPSLFLSATPGIQATSSTSTDAVETKENAPVVTRMTVTGQQDNVVLHMFPDPDKDADRFRAWVFAIGGDIISLEDNYVYKYRRVCHDHFEHKYLTWSKMLTKNAVPTLHVKGSKETQDQPIPTGSKVPKTESSVQVLKQTADKLLKPTVTNVQVFKPTEYDRVLKTTESSLQVYKSPGSKGLKPPTLGVQVLNSETSPKEQAIEAEITYEEEEYLEPETLDDELEEQPKEEGPFSWQKYAEEIIALDENVPADDDVKFCGEAQLVPDSSEPVSQTQEEYSCNACNERITGVRYVCVVCADWDLCGACEALRHHPRHYVLRVPPGKPRSETAWVIATLRQMLASREDPELTLVKEEVKSEDPLAHMDVPFEAREDDADDVQEMRNLDTDSIEDVDERIDTDRTSDLLSTLQKRSTTAHPEAVPSKKPKLFNVLKAVPIQRKDITGNVVMLGKYKTDNSHGTAIRTLKKVILSMEDLKKNIPQLETSKVTTWDAIRKQNAPATIQKPKLLKETGRVISLDDLRKQTVPVLKQTSQQETGKVFTLVDIMKQIDVVDKKQKITIIAAPVKQKASQIGTDKIILQKGVVSLKEPTHVVDSPKITVTAGPGKKTSHIQSDTISLSKKIVTLKQPECVAVSGKLTPESGETILLDDTISDIVQSTESAVMGSPAESWNTVQVLETSSAGSMMLKVLENPRQLRVNITRLREDDIQNATQPSTSNRKQR